MNNFDRIAPLYDFMSRAVFGKSIIQSQTYFFNTIKPNSSVLIIGGGTGKVLNYLDALAMPLTVTYVEQSRVMLKKSEKRRPFPNLQVEFIFGNETSIPTKKFDMILTAFFLDVFKEDQLKEVLKVLSSRLKSRGQWIVTDFIKSSITWQLLLVRFMYFFFRVATDLEGDELLDFNAHLQNLRFVSVREKGFYFNMIKSTIYQRTDIIIT